MSHPAWHASSCICTLCEDDRVTAIRASGYAAGVETERRRTLELIDAWIENRSAKVQVEAGRRDATTHAGTRLDFTRRMKQQEAAVALLTGLRERIVDPGYDNCVEEKQ